jgi:hypothetical protein
MNDYEYKIAQMKADDERESRRPRRLNPPAKPGDYCWPSEEIIPDDRNPRS